MASAAQVGMEIALAAIVVPELARRLCAEYGLDPLGAISSGALLASATLTDVAALLGVWQDCGWAGGVIGHVTSPQQGMTAWRDGQAVAFPHFAADELTKFWSE